MVTLKANYQETLNKETVEVIYELIEYPSNYGLEEILDFDRSFKISFITSKIA